MKTLFALALTAGGCALCGMGPAMIFCSSQTLACHGHPHADCKGVLR